MERKNVKQRDKLPKSTGFIQISAIYTEFVSPEFDCLKNHRISKKHRKFCRVWPMESTQIESIESTVTGGVVEIPIGCTLPETKPASLLPPKKWMGLEDDVWLPFKGFPAYIFRSFGC